MYRLNKYHKKINKLILRYFSRSYGLFFDVAYVVVAILMVEEKYPYETNVHDINVSYMNFTCKLDIGLYRNQSYTFHIYFIYLLYMFHI